MTASSHARRGTTVVPMVAGGDIAAGAAVPCHIKPGTWQPHGVQQGGEICAGKPDGTIHAGFEGLVGAAGWRRLTPMIRSRFGASAESSDTHYVGAMASVRCSFAGYLLAQVCRLIGTPLAPYEGTDVPITVHVHEDAAKGGVAWDRKYFFAGRAPITVTSTKVIEQGRLLLECVGGGFGMRLRVFEKNGALHFLSQQYFWRCGAIRLRLPAWLTPGVAHVVHSDLGGGRFRFEMTIEHPLLGETFYQDGSFQEEEG